MKKNLEIFEPAMCCSTGVCGPSVDQELLRITNLVDGLKDNEEVEAHRYNLTSNPQAFVANQTVLALMQEHGKDVLPITLVNGDVVKTGSYPTMDELKAHCELLTEETGETCDCAEGCCIVEPVEVKKTCCGGGNTGCC